MIESATPERWRQIGELFEAARGREEEEAQAFLDQACAGDGALFSEVTRLLAAHRQARHLVPSSAFAGAGPEEEGEEPSAMGRQLGSYRLLHEIGRGGMGVVYLAERADEQYDKRVAVKLIKRGMDSDSVLRRFRNERQILAQLEHPNIARLIDGGTTADGLPYFVMEPVDGLPIDVYCDARGLSVADRLELFRQVCSAVSHAHRHLVVHRDIKPSNVLVTREGVPKLLDFGIARILERQEESGPLTTGTRSAPMTPEYASPEQLQGLPATTSSDVYSLGVVLYELLCGGLPSTVAPERSRRLLRGDLETIVRTALRPESLRRYLSVDALAQDIQRYLAGRPVAARPDTLAYRGAKFIRRHRVAVAAATLLLVSLVAGTVATARQAQRARVQERLARAEQARAEGEARKAGAVKEFLKSLFSASSPSEARGKNRTARELLDHGARRLEAELGSQPEVASEVSRLIAHVYHELGEYDPARALLTRELARRRAAEGARSLAVAEVLSELGDVSYQQSRFDEAAALYEEALAIQRERRGERSPEVAAGLRDVANVRWNLGDVDAAEDLQQRALAIFVETRGEDSREAISMRESLANTYAARDRDAEAAAMQGPVAAWRERHLGPDDPGTLTARHNYAHYLLKLGRTAEGTSVIEDVVARRRRVLGPRHEAYGKSLQVLARARDTAGRAREALPMMAEALDIHRAALGGGHLQVAIDLSWQGMIEARTGRLFAAERDCRSAFAVFRAQPAAAPKYLATVQGNLGLVLAEAGKLPEAAQHLDEVLAFYRARHLEGHALARVLDALADVARRRGQTNRAVELSRQALAVESRSTGEETLSMALARAHAGAALSADGQEAEGERLLREAMAWMERALADDHPDLATARFLLGQALARRHRLAAARPLLESALRSRIAHFGPSDPRTLAARSAYFQSPWTTKADQ